ncbi:Hypothetical protein NTJ_12615 [Nesidiocoris tenuis]|uniref:Uncharacterized protein n=1 Tax=Nesidiocoris tenuis TaxID=355587 RepID=A0ABN7B699_9HEMI|nr:Hypothetical protein NTJ_12615 [Nesidiocoris tenuis]
MPNLLKAFRGRAIPQSMSMLRWVSDDLKPAEPLENALASSEKRICQEGASEIQRQNGEPSAAGGTSFKSSTADEEAAGRNRENDHRSQRDDRMMVTSSENLCGNHGELKMSLWLQGPTACYPMPNHQLLMDKQANATIQSDRPLGRLESMNHGSAHLLLKIGPAIDT